MCGIFGYLGHKNNAASIVFEGLKLLEYRGYDSWGVGIIPNGDSPKIVIKKKAGKIDSANVADLPQGSLAFGHTRWATNGGVTDANAHPHLSGDKKIAVIHNGIFENYETIKNKLIETGHVFESETDTEVIAHLIESYMDKLPFIAAVRQAFLSMEGANAIIVVNPKERLLIAAKNSSPLILGFGKGENLLASDASALLPYTQKVHYMEDGELAVMKEDQLELFTVKTGQAKKPTIHTLTWRKQDTEIGNFPHFMLKEIHEQPKILANISQTLTSEIEAAASLIAAHKATYLMGCGTAAYACMAGEYFLSNIAGHPSRFLLCSESDHLSRFITKDDLVIALSQSGETIDAITAVNKAKNKSAAIMALTNSLGSTLYRISDHKTLIGAGPEVAVASTKVYSGMLAHLILWSYALAGNTPQGKRIVAKVAAAAGEIMAPNQNKKIKALAAKFKKAKDIFVIGKGVSYPAALEGALKIKECSYAHAEGMAAGELKHGTLAVVEPGAPCFVVLAKDESYQVSLNAASEAKARGAHIIGISPVPHSIFDDYIPVRDCAAATIIPSVIAMQLFAYHLTVAKGLDPDKPRNLAKSVTVK